MLYNELFANEFDTQILRKKLAKAIGLNEAIVLNQLNYWIEKNKRLNNNFYDNRYWVYNTYENWKNQDFEYWSIDTIKRTFTKLEKMGYVLSGNYNNMPMDRTKWYTIDYEKMEELAQEIAKKSVKSTISAKCTDGRVQNAPSNNHRILNHENNKKEQYSATTSHERDFSLDVVKKAEETISDSCLVDAVKYYLEKYKSEMCVSHPNISYASLSNFVKVVYEQFDGNIECLYDGGMIGMIDRHFETNY